MKLHLPVRLFKSVLVCLSAVAACTVGSASAWAEPQNLTFGDSSLTWDAQGDSFVNEAGEAAAFAEGDNVSFTGESIVTLGLDITAGTLDIAAGADVTIDLGNYTLNADTISLSGTLNVGDSLSIASGSTLAVQNDAAVLDSALVLGEKSGLAVDAAASLNNNTLTLQGGSNLILTAAGDGKTYTLFTGVSGLVDAEGNAITLDSTNNAIANYFDTTRPGTGFWAGATLVLNDGALQLVRHNETVKEAVTITTRRTSGADYQYYAGVTFENIEYAAVDSDAYGGAIDGVSSANTLSNNGSVTFSGNTASSSYYACGGAIYGNANSSISVTDNGSVCFVQNMVSCGHECCGGAIYGDEYSSISLNNNGSVEFKGNTTSAATSVALYSYGGAIYGGTHSRISLSGNGIVIFSKNSAPATDLGAGGAIYGGDGSTITLSNNISINCSDNMAFSFGGAIYGGNGSTITLSNNGSVTFCENSAPWGGAIVSTKLNILDNASVVFNENSALNQGAAINGSNISLSENGSVIFRGNTVSALDAQGGAIYTFGNLSICNNDSVLFEKNAEVSRGTYRLRSIYAGVGSDAVISLSAAAGKIIEFRDSVYVGSGTSVNLNQTYGEIEQKGDIIFTGAMTVDDLYEEKGNVAGTEEEIRLSRTTEVNALTNLYGGRLRVEDGAIYQGQGITAHEGSGATVRVKDATLSHSGYDLTFNAGTTLELEGTNSITGNVQMLEDSILSFDGTETQGVTILSGNMSFTGAPTVSLGDTPAWTGENHVLLYVDGTVSGWAADTLTVLGSAYGSANLHWLNNELLVLNYNAETFNPHFRGDLVISSRQQGSACHKYKYFADVSFENITEASNGGAIYGSTQSTITLSNNGSVTFSGNTAKSTSDSGYNGASGGAIYGSFITLSNNKGSITFSGNTASSSDSYAYGGAIYASGNLSIRNNESVLFEKNVEKSGSSYRLRSIYAGGSGDAISLSAAVGKSIEFRDSVYIASGSTVNLNADYTYLDEAGESVTIRQTGDIIFTGADTEQHLNDLLEAAGAGRTATAQEILNSRTTEVCAMTNLYGGRLRVEEGAIYQGQGITAHEASEATVRVKDATLSHAGYNLEFNAGTALEVAGNSTIRGNVNLKEGSLFKLEKAASLSLYETLEADAATLTVNGGALLEGGATLNASLTLADGATLDMDALDVGAVTLNGALTFGGQVTMGDKLLGILSEMSGWEESVTLFTGLTDLVLPAVAADDAADRLWVGNVFSNLAGNENYYFNYVPEVGSLAVVHVPEPATTSLGLAALVALAARRRRK